MRTNRARHQRRSLSSSSRAPVSVCVGSSRDRSGTTTVFLPDIQAGKSIISCLGRQQLASGILLPSCWFVCGASCERGGPRRCDDPCRGTRDNYKGTSACTMVRPSPFNGSASDSARQKCEGFTAVH